MFCAWNMKHLGSNPVEVVFFAITGLFKGFKMPFVCDKSMFF